MPQTQEKKGSIFLNMLRYAVRLFAMVRGEIPFAIVFMVLLSVIDAMFPLIRGKTQEWLIDALAEGVAAQVMTARVEWAFAIFIILTTYAGVDGYVINYVRTIVFERIRTKIDLVLRAGMARLDVAHYEDPSFMDTVDKAAGEGIGRVRQFLDNQMSIVIDAITVVASAIAIGYQKWWLLPLLVVTTTPELVVRGRYARKIWDLRTKQAELQRKLGADRTMFGSIAGLVELKLGGLVHYFLGRMEEKLGILRSNEITYTGGQSRALVLSGLVAYAGIVVALYVFTLDVVNGGITVGRLVFLLGAMGAFKTTLGSFFRGLSANYEHTLFLHDVFELLDAAPRVPRPVNPQVLNSEITPEIRFENVSFAYPNTEKEVLKNVSFTMKPGEKIALIGVNGAGKTTLIKLLCRFYDPTEGRITIGGIDLREIDIESWYRVLGVLFQDFITYRGHTVREAIQVGDIGAHEKDVEHAAHDAEADMFIEELPDKYEQMIGKVFKGGTNLSGGQMQKLALARVFFRDPKVWILDEPTAAIDAEAEAHIFERIEQTLQGRSAIVISHRFSTVRNADQILVLKDGTISEQGTHEELIQGNKDYARLFNLQAKRYQGSELMN